MIDCLTLEIKGWSCGPTVSSEGPGPSFCFTKHTVEFITKVQTRKPCLAPSWITFICLIQIPLYVQNNGCGSM